MYQGTAALNRCNAYGNTADIGPNIRINRGTLCSFGTVLTGVAGTLATCQAPPPSPPPLPPPYPLPPVPRLPPPVPPSPLPPLLPQHILPPSPLPSASAPTSQPPLRPSTPLGPGVVFNAASNQFEIACDSDGRRLADFAVGSNAVVNGSPAKEPHRPRSDPTDSSTEAWAVEDILASYLAKHPELKARLEGDTEMANHFLGILSTLDTSEHFGQPTDA